MAKATAPKTDWKVYRDGEFVAAFKFPEDAAVLVSATGGQVRFGHSMVVWTEGKEDFSAGESYDRAGEVMEQRRREKMRAQFAKFEAQQAAAKARREALRS